MSDTGTNTGAFGASGNSGAGLEFRDGPEDMARMQRYEAYLNLQAKADGLTDAQYLAELDRIMEPGDKFDKGDGSYSKSGPGSEMGGDPNAGQDLEQQQEDELRRVELQESLEAAESDPAQPEGDGVNSGSGMLQADAGDELQAGAGGPYPDAAADEIAAGDAGQDLGVEAGTGTETVTNGGDGPAENMEQALDAGQDETEAQLSDGVGDPEGQPEPGMPEGLEENDGAAYGDPEPGASDAAQEEIGPYPDGQVHAPDDPEAQADAPAGLEPDVPAGAVMDGPQAGGAPEPGAAAMDAGQARMHVDGQTVMHEQQYQVHDALDELSVATGLASSVQTAEYIPPHDVTVEVQPAAPDPNAPVPGRTALAQKVIDIDAARYAEPVSDHQLDGPGA